MALTCVWQGHIGRSCKVHHPRPQGADTRGAARREIGVTHQSHLRPFEPQVSALSSRVSSLAVHSLQSRLGSPAVTVCSSSNNCWLTSLDRSNRSNWAQGCIKWNIHPCVAHIISWVRLLTQSPPDGSNRGNLAGWHVRTGLVASGLCHKHRPLPDFCN